MSSLNSRLSRRGRSRDSKVVRRRRKGIGLPGPGRPAPTARLPGRQPPPLPAGLTLVAQLQVEQGVDAVHGLPAGGAAQVGTPRGEEANEEAQVVEGHQSLGGDGRPGKAGTVPTADTQSGPPCGGMAPTPSTGDLLGSTNHLGHLAPRAQQLLGKQLWAGRRVVRGSGGGPCVGSRGGGGTGLC